MADAKAPRKKAATKAVRTEEQTSRFVIGKCVTLTIHVRTKCKDGTSKPKPRLAMAKSADNRSSPLMTTMSLEGGPSGGGGGGGEPDVSIDITIDVSN